MTRGELLGALGEYSKPLSPVLLANINMYLGIGQHPAANSPWADVADFCYLSYTIQTHTQTISTYDWIVILAMIVAEITFSLIKSIDKHVHT
jgi:hypothetical protein